MKVQQMLEAHYEASNTASDMSRKLAFAGIAVIWVLKIGKDSGGIAYSPELISPLFFFVLALAADLSQYIYKAIIWGVLNSYHFRCHKNNDADVEISNLVNFPTNIFFLGKITSVIVAYAYLLCFLKSNMS